MTGQDSGTRLDALVSARAEFPKLVEKDFAKAAGILIKKLLVSGGQTKDTIARLRELVGSELFDKELKSLTDRQAMMLAKRIDKGVNQADVSTAELASLHVLRLLDGSARVPVESDADASASPAEPEPAPEPQTEPQPEPEPEPVAARPANAYFGRKSFRVGD